MTAVPGEQALCTFFFGSCSSDIFFVSMYCYGFTQLILRKGPIKLLVESRRHFRRSFHVQGIGFGTAADSQAFQT